MLVIETSWDVRRTEHGFDEATAAPLSMQCAHGYSGCNGALSIGCQVALAFLSGCGRGRRCGSRLRDEHSIVRGMASWSQKRPGAAAALEPYAILGKPQISARFAV
jgi:hypothetical protein